MFGKKKKQNKEPDYTNAATFSKLIAESNDPKAVINAALERIPEQDKQTTIDTALYNIVTYYKNINIEKPVAALLEAGANPAADLSSGFKSVILAKTIENNPSPPVIQMLYEGGASFDDALFVMKTNKGWTAEHMTRLEVFREKFSGKQQPVTGQSEEVILETLLLLQEQMRVLTERVDRLSSPVSETAPEEEKTTREKKPYPAIKADQPKKSPPPGAYC